jgi:ribonuclease HII
MPTFDLEIANGFNTGVRVAGVDEVGRGPLAGPVVAAAVIFPPNFTAPWLSKVKDSKKLSEKQRAVLAPLICNHCEWSIAEATVDEIDRLNILQASLLAMHRAVAGLPLAPQHILIDGNQTPKHLPCPATTVIGGDATSLSIAAAAIIAKVHRDSLMQGLHDEFPTYGWATNAGYGSAVHMAALATYGATPYHRQSFAPVAAALKKSA